MPAVLARHPLWFILAVALGLRLATAVGVQTYLEHEGRDYLIAGDADGYWMLAGKLAAGDEYSVYEPPRRVLRMPGFPTLLAAVRIVAGDSFLAARVVLAVVGTAACGAVYLLGRTLRDQRTGLIAAALAAFWPVLVGFSALILSETTFALLLTLSLAAMAKLVRISTPLVTTITRPQVVWAIVVGGSIVFASYVRPTWLPAVGLFALSYWLWGKRTRATALLSAIVIVSAIVTLAPWTIRNWLVTGRFVPTTLWVGPSLYDGLNPQATGESDMRFFDEERLLDHLTEYEMDRAYRQRSWQFVRDNPGRTAELTVAKLWRYWRPWPGTDQFSAWPARIAVAGYYLPILALAAAGLWAGRRDAWTVGLAAGPILLFAAVHCVFVGSLRYRLPAEYPLCVLSALGLQATCSSRFGK